MSFETANINGFPFLDQQNASVPIMKHPHSEWKAIISGIHKVSDPIVARTRADFHAFLWAKERRKKAKSLSLYRLSYLGVILNTSQI